MKRFLIVVVITLWFLPISAQEHLSFRGIPIDGPISEYVDKLTQTGFKLIQKSQDNYVLSGNFTGYKCRVFVESSVISHTVHSVCVLLNQSDDWATIKNDYTTIKKGLTLKYGEPSNVKEEFRTPYRDGDGSAYMAFHVGNADWYSVYTTPSGVIDLYIREQGFLDLSVIIKYTDKINEEKSIQELTNEL